MRPQFQLFGQYSGRNLLQNDEHSRGSNNGQGTVSYSFTESCKEINIKAPKTISAHLADHQVSKYSKQEGDYEMDQQIEQQSILLDKLKNFFFEIKLKNSIKRIINGTRSRMFRNLTYKQLSMISDNAYNNEQSANIINCQIRQSTFDLLSTQKSSFFWTIVSQLDSIIPVFSPHNLIKKGVDYIGILAVLFLFFLLSIAVSFQVKISEIVNIWAIKISFLLLFLRAIIKLNTSFIRHGTIVKSRHEIWKVYKRKRLVSDFFSLITVLAFILLDYFTPEITLKKNNDSFACIQFILFFPFFLSLRNINQTFQKVEDKIAFKQRELYIVQLVRLFAIIIFIDHLMACLWIFNAKFSTNQIMNWIISMQIQTQPWHYQYVVAFYYSTATMTTVGYGDVTARNFSEFILSTILVLTSSGVFGFTLSQIGAIFQDISSQNKELKRKLRIINLHMENKNVNHSLRKQIREYLEYLFKQLYIKLICLFSRYIQQENNENFAKESALVVQDLNENLKKQLYLHQNKQIIEYLKQYFSQDLISNAILRIQQQQVKPQQIIYSKGSTDNQCFYFLEKGKVEIYLDCINPTLSIHSTKIIQDYFQLTKQLEEGSMFGIPEFFNGEERKVSIRAQGFVNLLKIQRDHFLNILKEFPSDLETFQYLKDRQLFLSDYRKINVKCKSCGNFDHNLSNCRYLHLVIDKQTHFTRLNHASYQIEQERRKNWENTANKMLISNTETQRREFRSKVLFNIVEDEDFDEFLYNNIQLFEDYEEEYLKYDFSYSYINRNIAEDDDDAMEDTQSSEYHNKLNLILPETNKQKIDSLENKRYSQEINFKEYNKQASMNQKIRESIKKTQKGNMETSKLYKMQTDSIKIPDLKKEKISFIDQNTINEAKESFSLSPRPSNYNEGLLKRLHFQNESQLKSTSSEEIPEKNLDVRSITDLPFSELFQNDKAVIQSSLLFLPLSIAEGDAEDENKQNQTGENTPISNKKIIRQSKKNFSFEYNERNLKKKLSFSQFKNLHQQKDKLKRQNSMSPEKKNLFKSNEENKDDQNTQISDQMKNLQAQIIHQMQQIIQRTQKQKTSQSMDKNLVQDSDFIAKQDIFRVFDKQKNYSIYFPQNNLSSILFNYTSKKNISQQQYLQMIQTANNTRVSPTFYMKSFSQINKNKIIDKLSLKKKKSMRQKNYSNNSIMIGDSPFNSVNGMFSNQGLNNINYSNSHHNLLNNLNLPTQRSNQNALINLASAQQEFFEQSQRNLSPTKSFINCLNYQNNTNPTNSNLIPTLQNIQEDKQLNESDENQNNILQLPSPIVKEDPSDQNCFEIKYNKQKTNEYYFSQTTD